LTKKFEKFEKGENSIEVISKRVNEISKLESNLEERVNKKFLKYKNIINEKEQKLKKLSKYELGLSAIRINFSKL